MRNVFFAALGSIGAALALGAGGGALVTGCGSSDNNNAAAPNTSDDGGGSGGTGGGDGATKDVSMPGNDAAGGGGPDSGTVNPPGDGGPNVGTGVGQLDAGPMTALPALPRLTNVVAIQREDSVGIDFDPVDDAVDYRVYPLPADGDVTVNGDGSVTVKNAIYRCAGIRQTFDVANNKTSTGLTPQSSDGTGLFTYDGNGYAWKTKVSDNPTLGYVYVEAGADRVPVYAASGVHARERGRLGESRLKIYTTDANERATLLGQGWRDDGIVFYVPPASADAASVSTVYRSQTTEPQAGKDYRQVIQYYFLDADMAAHTKDTTPPAAAFPVLKAAADGTKPLMAVMYEPLENHVELAVGKERYNRAANQGPGPLWHVEWSGITGPVTLVVEALASGCPFQGFLSPKHLDAPPHQTFYTLDELKAASPTGEVFVNGQYDGPMSPPMEQGANGVPQNGASPLLAAPTMSPKAVARSFVSVAPQPHAAADWDWYQGFGVGTDFGTVTTLPRAGTLCGPGSQPSVCGHWQVADVRFQRVQHRRRRRAGVHVRVHARAAVGGLRRYGQRRHRQGPLHRAADGQRRHRPEQVLARDDVGRHRLDRPALSAAHHLRSAGARAGRHGQSGPEHAPLPGHSGAGDAHRAAGDSRAREGTPVGREQPGARSTCFVRPSIRAARRTTTSWPRIRRSIRTVAWIG